MIEKGERWFSELLFVAIINLNLGESSVNLRKLFLLIIGKVLLQIHPYWSITSSWKKHQERGSHLCNLCKLLKINLQIILPGFSYAYGTAFSGLQTKLLDMQVTWGIKRSEIFIFFPLNYTKIFSDFPLNMPVSVTAPKKVLQEGCISHVPLWRFSGGCWQGYCCSKVMPVFCRLSSGIKLLCLKKLDFVRVCNDFPPSEQVLEPLIWVW